MQANRDRKLEGPSLFCIDILFLLGFLFIVRVLSFGCVGMSFESTGSQLHAHFVYETTSTHFLILRTTRTTLSLSDFFFLEATQDTLFINEYDHSLPTHVALAPRIHAASLRPAPPNFFTGPNRLKFMPYPLIGQTDFCLHVIISPGPLFTSGETQSIFCSVMWYFVGLCKLAEPKKVGSLWIYIYLFVSF